jgi:hypothetical protein
MLVKQYQTRMQVSAWPVSPPSAFSRAGSFERRAAGKAPSAFAPPVVHDVLRSPGQPLDAATRAFIEPRFGHDFSKVRVHTDQKAAESARSVGSLAYTVGNHLSFDSGRFAPREPAGRHLLSHELAHVVQQGSEKAATATNGFEIGEPTDALEREAERTASAVLQSGAAPDLSAGRPALLLQRQLAPDAPPQDPPAPAAPARPVYFCSKSVALGAKHAFFRVGGQGAGNDTYELEHDEKGDHCACGIQGWPTTNYPEDKDSTDAACVSAAPVTESCLKFYWNTYPIGRYCALGPNSNTYAYWLAKTCGGAKLEAPGRLPGKGDSPPAAGTASAVSSARTTPIYCPETQCSDQSCKS